MVRPPPPHHYWELCWAEEGSGYDCEAPPPQCCCFLWRRSQDPVEAPPIAYHQYQKLGVSPPMAADARLHVAAPGCLLLCHYHFPERGNTTAILLYICLSYLNVHLGIYTPEAGLGAFGGSWGHREVYFSALGRIWEVLMRKACLCGDPLHLHPHPHWRGHQKLHHEVSSERSARTTENQTTKTWLYTWWGSED